LTKKSTAMSLQYLGKRFDRLAVYGLKLRVEPGEFKRWSDPMARANPRR
jgi:hypothetical protein